MKPNQPNRFQPAPTLTDSVLAAHSRRYQLEVDHFLSELRRAEGLGDDVRKAFVATAAKAAGGVLDHLRREVAALQEKAAAAAVASMDPDIVVHERQRLAEARTLADIIGHASAAAARVQQYPAGRELAVDPAGMTGIDMLKLAYQDEFVAVPLAQATTPPQPKDFSKMSGREMLDLGYPGKTPA